MLSTSLDQYLDTDPDTAVLLQIYEQQLSSGSFEQNLLNFGVVNKNSPSSINIYTDSFDDKDGVVEAINTYNKTADTENQILYTDYMGLLMSTVTTIINVISYILVAFVGISLVVSSIMIGIITFISVLERTKEIGVLRALGASKRNISSVFTAKTMLIGLLSGVLGIGISLILLIPINAIIHNVTGINDINTALPWGQALALVALSIALTLIAGIIPSRIAAKKDPVDALRSE